MSQNYYGLLICMASLLSVVVAGYDVDRCYCYEDWDITLKGIQVGFTNEVQQEYYYIGVMPRAAANKYDPCDCVDVTRFQDTVRVKDTALFGNTDTVAAQKVKDAIEDLASVKGVPRFLRVKVVPMAKEGTDVRKFKLEIITMSYNEAMVAPNFALVSSNDYAHDEPGVGKLAFSAFAALRCSSDPPAKKTYGTRDWTGKLLPSVKASFGCITGYYLKDSGSSHYTCDHGTLNWVGPANVTTATECQPGCSEDPPTSPISENDWKGKRDKGTKIIYTCQHRHQPRDGKIATSTCLTTSKWSILRKDFACVKTLCPEKIPQVPSFCKSTFDGVTRFVNTRIFYTCLKGYSPSQTGDIQTICFTNGSWAPLPLGFECQNDDLQKRLGTFDMSVYQQAYDPYADPDDNPPNPSINAFVIVTIPTIVGLSLLIFCCLCFTRTDSPMFKICGGGGGGGYSQKSYSKSPSQKSYSQQSYSKA